MAKHKKLTLDELIRRIAKDSGQPPRLVEMFLGQITATMVASLNEGVAVPLRGLGVLEPTDRAPRKGRNPKTGAEIDIPASRGVVFRPGKALKDALNGGTS